ncbi:glutathione peroxidase [Algivirga pacifica]|uniref:Glutathione peroxidase n=1 Tax=Algivirga pacifica TaxID=1162670 RepID=A0ABP9D8D3_9BACT
MTTSFYELSANTLHGGAVSMETFKGKVVLVVNTASKCGFTPQYRGLEKLYQDYKDLGLVILGFPCNQFMNQEPGDAGKIEECLMDYEVSFPVFEKVHVNGSNAHPIFVFLKDRLGGFMSKGVKWNFTKFLIDKNGSPRRRFAPITSPKDLERYVQDLLLEQ